ncbi:hypothetical protein [Aquimarina sp. 2304DJ70-9]|uniref:hypothetical protein n=1 Tax=Aquimarina penaris TaxID=3231044 RepID=UPI003462417E
MKNAILCLGTILLFGFTTNTSVASITTEDVIVTRNKMTTDIDELNWIIQKKLQKAEQLEAQATVLLEKDGNSEEGLKFVKHAKLQRAMTLKYSAAIACKTRFLE